MAIQPDFHWQFSEREGSIATDSISGIEGNLTNAIFPKHDHIEAAISLGTPSSQVSFGNEVGQFGTDDFTIAFWMTLLDDRPDRDGLDIVGNRSVGGHGNWVSLIMRVGGSLQFEVDDDSNGTHYINSRTDNILEKHKWYHIAVIREGTTLRTYVNGVLEAEGTSNTGVANINTDVDFRLGSHRRHTPGALYEDLRIYHTALDETQIQSLTAPQNRPISPGLIPNFHWQFSEREGSIATDSISGIEGNLTNAIFPKHDRIEAAISLGTPESQVSFGNEVGQFGTDDFTIAFWMMLLDDRPTPDGLDIVGSRSVGGLGNWVSLRMGVGVGGNLRFEVDDDSNGTHYINSQTDDILKKQQWYHIAVVREGTTLRIYVDGVVEAETISDRGVANINTDVDFRLGSHHRHTPGALYKDLRIYHTALDETQIQSLTAPQNRPISPGLIPNFHWQFSEREGSIATDSISGITGQFNTAIYKEHGRIGPAIVMASIKSHVQFTKDVGRFGTSDFTIAFGMQIINTKGQGTLDIIGNRNVSGHGNWVCLRIHDKNRLRFEVDENNQGKNHIVAQTDKILGESNWYHVAVVREGTTLRIYIDGVLQAEASSATGVANINNDVPLRLGDYIQESPTIFYEDLRIYHTALSQLQIQNLIPPVNRPLRPGQIELVATSGAQVIVTQEEADLFRFSSTFQRLRLGPNTGATFYKEADFTGAAQKLYADVPNIRHSKVGDFPRSVHIWSTVGDPFQGNWIIKAPNGQNLSRNVHRLTTSSNHTAAELFSFHHQPNFDLPLLMPAASQELSQLRVEDESTVLVVNDREPHEDAFSIIHPAREVWLALATDESFIWTQTPEDRAIFHRTVKIADNEGQVGDLKAGEVALYDNVAYKGKTWIFSDNEHNDAGNFMSLRSFAGMDNKVSSIRVGPYTGVTLFANENQIVDEARRELDVEDFTDNVPSMLETQIGNDNISSLKIFRTVAPETIFTSVTSKLSQDYRMTGDDLEEFSAYRTILRLAPDVEEIEVSATDLTTIEVEGNSFEIDELRSVTLRANMINQIMITSEADGLSTPGLKCRTGNMPENQFVVIFPHRDAHERIVALEDGALWNATDAQGNLIVDQTKHTRSEIASVQSTIQRTMASVVTTEEEVDGDATVSNTTVRTVSGLSSVASVTQVVDSASIENPWTLNFTPKPVDSTIQDGSAGLVAAPDNIWEEPVDQTSFEQLYAQAEIASVPITINNGDVIEGNFAALSIGGFFRSIGDAFKDAVNVTVGVFEGALNAIIDLGGRIVRFVLDTAQKVADFVTAVVEKVVESVKQFIEFLRFLFAWDDILETKRFLVQTINNAFDSVSGMVEAAKDPVSEFFENLQEGLNDGVDSLIRLTGVDADDGNDFELPEAAEWFLNKLLTGRPTDSINQDAQEFVSNELEDVLEELSGLDLPPIVEALLGILDRMKELPKIGTKIRDEVLIEVVETLIANPQRPELVIISILETIRTISSDLLVLGEDIALTFFDLIIEAIDSVRALLNKKLDIPVISALFKVIGGGDLTLLNLTGMLLGIASTVASKLLFGESPFNNLEQPDFPAPLATGDVFSFAAQSDTDSVTIDIDNQRRKVRGFGIMAIMADLLNGFLSTGLDLIPEIAEEILELETTHLEIISLTLSGFSWLASFPASRVEAGGYPYNLLLGENQVSKSKDEQEYWERVMWGWRTFVFGFDIVYMATAAAATSLHPNNKAVRALFQKQRLSRGTEITAGLAIAFALVDLGLTGRYLATIPGDEKVGREISNEIMSFLPTAFCWMRMITSLPSLLGLFAINVTSIAVTTSLNIIILEENVHDLS